MPKPLTLGYTAGAGDHFLHPILEHLEGQSWRTKAVKTWPDPEVDLLWIEWCDPNAVNFTKPAPIIPIVVRCHSFEVFTDWPAAVTWEHVSRLVFVADHVRDYLTSRVAIEGPEILVIPNGFDLDRFTPDGPRMELAGDPVIAWPGTVTAKKGPMLFVQVVAEVRREFPGAVFHVAGEVADPRFAAYFEHVLPRMGLSDAVVFHGHLPFSEMPAFYRGCEFVLSTSPWEGTQQSVGEAMACGCWPMVHDWRGSAALYGGGWRTPPGVLYSLAPSNRAISAKRRVEMFRTEWKSLPTLASSLAAVDAMIEGLR